MAALKHTITSGLKKQPELLYACLAEQVDDNTIVKQQLDAIADLLSAESDLTEKRKKLSRQIGAARKEGGDAAALIEQVSSMSSELKRLEDQIDASVAAIEAQLSCTDEPTELALPQHLNVQYQPFNIDVSSLQISHDADLNAAEWQAFVDSIPHASIYHHCVWHELLHTQFGHEPYYITCKDAAGRLCGVFPTIHMNSKLFGSFLISMPYFNYGGPLSMSVEVEQAMMQYATNLGTALGCSHLEVRDIAKREDWLAKQHKVTMVLPLPATDALLDEQLGTKVRAQVKRAAREDLEFTLGGAELLDDFYRVFSHNMRDLGTPVYSKHFFAGILAAFPQKSTLAIVRHKGKPVAAGFLLGHNDKLEIPWASSLRKANPLGANMYMYRQILSVAIDKQYQYFDFGRSSIGASTHKYKKQWGAKEHPLYWHYWLKDSDELPELNPNNPKYKLVIGAWKKLPVAVANIIGPKLVGNLP